MSNKMYNAIFDKVFTDEQRKAMVDLYMKGINHDGHSWVTYGDVEDTVAKLFKEALNGTDK